MDPAARMRIAELILRSAFALARPRSHVPCHMIP